MARSSVIKYALLVEAIGTILPGLYLFYDPASLLKLLGVSTVLGIDQLAIDFIQWIGTFTVSFGLFCLYGSFDYEASIKSRRLIYYAMGSTELSLLGFMSLQAATKRSEGITGGIDPQVLQYTGLNIASLAVWRSFVLLAKPHWFGDEDVPKGKKRQ